MNKSRVLVGSPVHQHPAILNEFLLSLTELVQETVTVDYMFMDDNEEAASSKILQDFQKTHSQTVIRETRAESRKPYWKDEHTHYWNQEQIWKVAAMKDEILSYASEHDYDYVLLIDSDLVLHPRTLEQLLEAKKDIVSNIFWTVGRPHEYELPQVWLQDVYTLFAKKRNETLSDEEISYRTNKFLSQLRIPGIYEVGGLGACTLISRNAIVAGVRFAEIKNVSFWGEDRHFCIRAQVLGFDLYVDTHLPAYHIYRDSELPGVAEYKQMWRAAMADLSESVTISLCLTVMNEEHSLARCLSSVQGIADEIVVVDTGSSDKTKEIASLFTEAVYDFEWNDDLSAARNFAFGKATKQYIMWMDANDVLKMKDRKLLLELKKSLDPSVDSVTMPYYLAFDTAGNVSHSIRYHRIVRRDRQFTWAGAIHAYLEASGNVHHSEIAVTYNNKTPEAKSDRNLQLYRKQMEQGELFLARDLLNFANELSDHAYDDEAVVLYLRFLEDPSGRVEDRSTACLRLADCYSRLGKREQQITALLQSMEFGRPRAEACCRLGTVFFNSNEIESSAYWYELATTLEPPGNFMGTIDHPSWTWVPHLQLCVCYDRLGLYEKANVHNDLAFSYHPTHPSILSNKRYFDWKLAGKK